MAALARRVTVTTSATQLNTFPTDGTSGAALGVRNPAGSGVTIAVGGSTVTTADGYELDPGESMTFDLDPGENVYAIAASSVSVHVLELGV